MIITGGFILLISLILSAFSIRKIISISHKKRLFDEPTEKRKIHTKNIPNLGGVGIFISIMFSCFLFFPDTSIHQMKYIIISAAIIFMVGLTDDLIGINPIKKIIPQIVVALLVTLASGFRFSSLYGFLGLTQIPLAISIIISVLFILLLINAFNLIDGINCLAGTIGLLACLFFAYYFWKMNEPGLLFLAISMCGGLIGFLFYNLTPAKIFMGDTGSLFLGFIISVLAINLIEINETQAGKPFMPAIKASPAFIFSLLIIPIFDTLRVFLLRLLKRKSPFSADRNHLHHRLLDLNLSHLQATGILLLVTMISVSLVFLFPSSGTNFLILTISILVMLFNLFIGFLLGRKERKSQKSIYHKESIFNFETLAYEEESFTTNKIQSTYTDETMKVIEFKQPSKKATGVL